MLEDEVQFDGFFIDDEEVGYLDQRGERQEVIPVCSLLRATAITRNMDGNDWGKLFSMKDPAGEEKHYHMRNAILAASPSAIISDLVDKGLRVGPHPKSRSSSNASRAIRAPSGDSSSSTSWWSWWSRRSRSL